MLDPVQSIIPLSLVPAGIKDTRQEALVQVFGEALGNINLSDLTMVDPLTVDARLLPYMIREFAAQEFIDTGLPEYVQRRILKDIWSLKSLHGYDAGVKLGLKMLGMSMQIEHWWQVEPKRAPNTHRLYFFVGENLFPDELSALNERATHAAIRMIDATKRLSQASEIFVGARLVLPRARTGLRYSGVSLRSHRMRMIQHAPHLRVSLATKVARVEQASITQRRMIVGQDTPNIRLHQKSAITGKSMPATSRRLTLKGGL
jgi:phage tail P2-like protein